MTIAQAQVTGGEPNPVDRNGLCLLSLDGGGVRGLSTLFILKGIMDRLNHERQQSGLPSMKPCDMFDLIGGTSTGGLIAIMLGLLEMDVDECIAAYTKLIQEVFSEKLHRSPVGITGRIQARFDSKKLKDAIEAVLVNKDVPVTTRLNNGTERGCKVFVCAASKETGRIARLRSYSLPSKVDKSATICEAALATSAATGLFDPVAIGSRNYVDGALGANNSVDQVEDEASNVWCSNSGDLKPLVKCFISLGTGNPGKKSIQDRLDKFVSDTLIAISTDTEATAEKFIGRWRQHYDSNRYFRFSVEQGLQQVGVAEYEQQGLIDAATERYLEGQAQTFRVRDCVENLKEKKKYADDMLEKVYTTWHNTKTSTARFALCFKRPKVNSVTCFVARQEELQRLHKELVWTGERRTVVLHGLGGMGKTQTTIAFAKKHCHDYSAVIWVDARDTTTLKQSYQRLAKRIMEETTSMTYINNALSNQDLDETVSAVKRWLDEPKNNRWLMIYDNYDDVNLHTRRSPSGNGTGLQVRNENNAGETGSKAYDIRHFLPEAEHGAILITTRSSSMKLGQRVQLRKLADLEDSLAILASTSSRTDLGKDPDATVLAKKLDGLPLALATAGAYLDQVATSCREYLEIYEKAWLCLQEERLTEYDHTLYTTWDISLRHIRLQNQNAADLLRLWAYFDNHDVWYELLRAGKSEKPLWLHKTMEDKLNFDNVVRLLCDHGLVEPNATVSELGSESQGYSMHACVHAWTIHVLNTERSQELAWIAIQCVASHIPSQQQSNYWVVQRRLLQHADQCIKMFDTNANLEDDAWMFHALGNLYSDQGRLKEAEGMYERALQGYEKALGPDHTSTLRTVNNLGSLYKNQGRLKEAEAMYERALQGREKALGPDHTSTLSTVNNLGLLYYNQGRLKEAEGMYERALLGYEKVLHPDTLRTYVPALNALENLGRLFERLGATDRALDHYDRARTGIADVFGSENERCICLSDQIHRLQLPRQDSAPPPRVATGHNLRYKLKNWKEKLKRA